MRYFTARMAGPERMNKKKKTTKFDKTKNKRKKKQTKREASMTNMCDSIELNLWIRVLANGACSYVQVLNCMIWRIWIFKEEEESKSHSPYTISVHRWDFRAICVLFTLFWLVSMLLLITSMFQAESHTASHERTYSLSFSNWI